MTALDLACESLHWRVRLDLQQSLFDLNTFLEYEPTTPLIKIDPTAINVKQIDMGTMVKYKKLMSGVVSRPAPGRKLAFFVTHNKYLLGLIALASPVINLAVRDEYLGLKENKGKLLRQYMDISICVGAQPVSWYWNIGKLLAMISYTLTDYVEERYPDDKLIGLTTTGINGKSAQYNRVYKFLGYTKGFGHEHISDYEYHEMISWMKKNNIEVPGCRFGDGANPRMRRISAYRKASGDKTVTLIHGNKRGVYYHEAVDSSLRQDVINRWYERWGLPRYISKREQIPPYINGLQVAGGEE